ncbi:DNA polymerase delta subunit 3 isoform X2 [Eurytemora carolleeae]|uniref:DNA polymerase delta subunit 3 isoform X2 n=1 Tax=Eurytemora carolleeae TaxID=1294199 RepID=UPI000C785F46|nr:DNA polymerase delta subunit 3 isoform X2 [Eurytemora carolleeae]|eukprot:XP_023348301.1 DNA polymerase delta subunit 3-like isoform X2 [Eurytemora affinis]
MENIDSMFLENLEEWVLEEDKVITYKFLSRALKCHVNVAKQMLFNFIEEQRKKNSTELGVVYLISASVNNDGNKKLKVLLVEEKNLSEEVKKLDKILSKHVYSVQKSKKISSTVLFSTDQISLKEDVYIANSYSAIKNKGAVPKPNTSFDRPVEPMRNDSKPEIKKEVVQAEIKETNQEHEKNESIFAKTKIKKSPEKEVVKKNSATKKPSSIASMFAKQSAKPVVSKQQKELSSETSPGKENMENNKIEIKKEAEKKADPGSSAGKRTAATTAGKKSSSGKKTGNKILKKPGKEDSKKRKRITIASDSESDADEDAEDVEESGLQDEEDEVAPPRSRIIDSDDEEIPSTPQHTQSSNPGKRKVRKEVDKTYIDEKGFMVTKKEIELVSDDELESEPEPAPAPAKIQPKAIDPVPAAKKAKLGVGNTKQPGIMSFFKKK